jgi:hypothetical protein
MLGLLALVYLIALSVILGSAFRPLIVAPKEDWAGLYDKLAPARTTNLASGGPAQFHSTHERQ